MEIITKQKSAEIFAIQEQSQIGDVRRYVSHLAMELEFTEVDIANLAIIANEMGTNLIKHTAGNGGEILVQAFEENQQKKIELLAIDKGPGFCNLHTCLQDGFSTTGTPGTGLGAIQRLSSFFDIYTIAQQGTILLAQVWHPVVSKSSFNPPPKIKSKLGNVCLQIPGESVCGDGWMMLSDSNCAQQTILISDGLGHGFGAYEASQKALSTFQQHHHETDVATLFKDLHKALHKTRGAAIAIVHLDWAQQTLSFAGIGNIEGKLLTQLNNNTLLSQSGIVGHEFRHIQLHTYKITDASTLILYSDGMKNRWNVESYPGLIMKHPSLIAGVLYRDHKRGRDDTTIIVLNRR